MHSQILRPVGEPLGESNKTEKLPSAARVLFPRNIGPNIPILFRLISWHPKDLQKLIRLSKSKSECISIPPQCCRALQGGLFPANIRILIYLVILSHFLDQPPHVLAAKNIMIFTNCKVRVSKHRDEATSTMLYILEVPNPSHRIDDILLLLSCSNALYPLLDARCRWDRWSRTEGPGILLYRPNQECRQVWGWALSHTIPWSLKLF